MAEILTLICWRASPPVGTSSRYFGVVFRLEWDRQRAVPCALERRNVAWVAVEKGDDDVRKHSCKTSVS